MKYKYLLSQVLDLLLISIGYFLMPKEGVIGILGIVLFLLLLVIYFIIYPIKNKKITLGENLLNLSVNNLEKISYIKLLLLNGVFYLSLLMFILPIKLIYILFIFHLCLNMLDMGLLDIFSKEMPFISNENKYKLFNVFKLFKFLLANIIDIFIFVIPFFIIYLLKDNILFISKNNVYILGDVSFVIIVILMLFYYYFYYVKINNGSTLGMQIVGISMKKTNKEKVPFLSLGILSFSLWFFIFLTLNFYHNYFLILTPILLQIIYIFIILISLKKNLKIIKYSKPKSKKIVIGMIFILFLSILSIKLTNNKEYYHIKDDYNIMLKEEDYWNKKGVYTKEQIKKVKEDLKEINISSLKELKTLIEDQSIASSVEYINLNKEVGDKYFKEDILYLKSFSNLKTLKINILADKFDLKYQFGYNYTKKQEEEYSIELINKIKKENKEFFDLLEKNDINYEISIKFN